MPEYNIYPAVDENYNFPPQIRQTIVQYPEIQDTQGRMAEAEKKLSESYKEIEAAKAIVYAASEDLRILEEIELPAAVEKLEQADQKASEELNTLDENLATAKQELEATEASINTLKNDTLPTMRQELDAADEEARATLATLDENLTTAQQELEATGSAIDTLKNNTLPQMRSDLEQADQDAQNKFAELDERLAGFSDDEALAPIRQALNDALDAVDTFSEIANTANQAANAASQAALEAAGIAESKGRVIVSETEPVGDDRRTSNIWIQPVADDPDTEIEEKATTYVYLESTDEWQPTTSSELAQAAQNALDAREAAQQAQQRADTAVSNAATAQAAAEAAQQTASQATLDAAEAHNEAVEAQSRLEEARGSLVNLTPWGGMEDPRTAGRQQSTYGWTQVYDPEGAPHGFNSYLETVVDEGQAANTGMDVVGDSPVQPGHIYRLTYRLWTDAATDNLAIGYFPIWRLSDGNTLNSSWGDGYRPSGRAGAYGNVVTTPFESGEWRTITEDFEVPTHKGIPAIGWIPRMHRWGAGYTGNGADGTSAVGDIWRITGIRLENVTDLLTAEAVAKDAKDRANDAYDLADSKVSPQEMETAIISSANGKNSITISTSSPSGDGVIEGDTWWRVDGSGDIFGQWVWNGNNWGARKIRSEVIANLDVNKLEVIGSANIAEAVIDKLWAETMAVKKVFAENVVVSSGANLFVGAQGIEDQFSSSSFRRDKGYASDWYIEIPAQSGQVGVYGSLGQWKEYGTPVRGGEEYRFSVMVRPDSTLTGSALTNGPVVFIRVYSSDDDWAWVEPNTFTLDGSILSGETWGEISGNLTVPEGYTHLVVGFYVNPSYSGAVRFSDPELRQVASTVLIGDGAVNANKVNAESVAGAVGKFVKIETDQLLASSSVTTPEAVIDKLWADGIASRTGTFNRLVVAGREAAPRMTEEGKESWDLSGTAKWVTTSHSTTGVALRLTPTSNDHGGRSGNAYGPHFPVVGGSKFQLSAKIGRIGSLSNGGSLVLGVLGYDKIGENATHFGPYPVRLDSGSSWGTEVGGEIEIAPEVNYIRVRILLQGASGTAASDAHTTVYDLRLSEKVGNVLIEDGAVNADKVNAESVAGAVGEFVKIETDQLLASSSVTTPEAVIDKLWTDGIVSKTATLGKAIVASPNVYGNSEFTDMSSIEHRWDKIPGHPGLHLIGAGVQTGTYDDSESGYIAADPGDSFRIRARLVGRTSPRSGRVTIYIRAYDRNKVYIGSSTYGVIQWTDHETGFKDGVYVAPEDDEVGYIVLGYYTQADVPSTSEYWLRDITARRMAGATLIEPGSVTTEHITVTKDLAANVVNAMSANVKELIVTDGATINNAKLIGDTWAERLTASKIIGNKGVFTGTVDANHINGGSFSGKTFTGGTFTGSRFNAVDSSGYGMVLEPQSTHNNAVLFFSDNGTTSYGQAAVWRNGYGVGVPAELMLRGAHGADVRIQDDLYVNKVMKAQNIESRANLLVDGNTNINRNLYVGGRAAGPNDGGIFTSNLDTDGIYLRGTGVFSTSGSSAIRNYGGFAQHGSAVYFHNLPSSSSSGNLVLDNNTRKAHQNFSTRRVKSDIQDWEPTPEQVLALQPRQWIHDDPNNDPEDNGEHSVGFIAEEVEEAGLVDLVVYDAEGRPQSLSYDRFSAAQQVVLQKHEKEISELRAENEELKSRLDRLEALLESKLAD